MTAQTSDRVSSLAARYSRIDAETLMAKTAKASTAEILASDIRSMSASLLRQDETKGFRKLIKHVFG